MKKFLRFKVKKCKDGRFVLSRLIRVYFLIQKLNSYSGEESDIYDILNEVYNEILKYDVKSRKIAAKKEIRKSYVDNFYELYCQYIILTGEV